MTKAKGKRPPAKDEPEEVLARRLHQLARLESRQPSANDSELQKLIRTCLYRKQDEVLHEALEHASQADDGAYRLLKDSIDEAAGTIVVRREDGQEVEVNAFVIPLFAHVDGGLHAEQCFQDQEAFELLRQSIKQAGLESQDANVVLVSHAYHLDEIDRIGHSQLNDMVREAFASMTGKKVAATPALERSLSGWPDNHFAPDELAVELRFLLGFSLKSMDDPFYRIPQDESAADHYFEARAVRFQQWAEQVAPLVKRCLVTDGTAIELHFLYQDLFHSGKERGISEYDTLQMIAELHHGLQAHGTAPEQTHAVIGPAEVCGETVLRVNLYAQPDDALVASAEKLLGAAADLQDEADDARDALMTMGVKSVALASGFDADTVRE